MLHEILLQALTIGLHPVVLTVALALAFVAERGRTVRLGTMAAALLMGAMDAAASSDAGTALTLLATSAVAGALAAEVVLGLVVPTILLGLAALRAVVAWLGSWR